MIETFGQRLKRVRIERGLYGSELARAVGVSKSFLCNLEGDVKTPGVRTLEEIADYLGWTMGELWRGKA